MIHHEPAVSHSIVDWVVTIALAFWGIVVSVLVKPDWVVILSVLLLVLKIAHESFRFWNSWRRSQLKRRAADQECEL